MIFPILAQLPPVPASGLTFTEWMLAAVVLGLLGVLTGGATWLFKVFLPEQQQTYRESLEKLHKAHAEALKAQQEANAALNLAQQEAFERRMDRANEHAERIIDKVATEFREGLQEIKSLHDKPRQAP